MSSSRDAQTSSGPGAVNRRDALRLAAAVPILGATALAYGRRGRNEAPAASPTAPDSASPEASPVGTPALAVSITMTQRLRFEPETIQVGQTITWVNRSAIPHTATGDPSQNQVNQTHPEYVALPEAPSPGAPTGCSRESPTPTPSRSRERTRTSAFRTSSRACAA
jgi:plastocyanin